jgi:hypothetical protein
MFTAKYVCGINQWPTSYFVGGGGVSTDSVEYRGQRERVSGRRQPPIHLLWWQLLFVTINLISYSKTFLF